MYCNRSTFPAFFRSVRFVDYAWFVRDCLLVLVIALAMPFEYTWVATKGKETGTMAEKKNLCALIPTALHEQVCEAREAAGLTTAQYITNLLTEYYEMKKNGGNEIMANTNTRTMAFQVGEDLFQRIKAHLERETIRTGKKLTQREFVLGLIIDALETAEQQAGTDSPEPEEQAAEEPGVSPCETPEGGAGTQGLDVSSQGGEEPCGTVEDLTGSEDQ